MVRYTKEDGKKFIEYIGPMIKAEGNARGYRIVSPTIAQAIIEGACGRSELAKYHNHFGLKCGTAWLKAGKPSVNMKTKEEYSGKLTTIKDYFRVFSSDLEGVKGYYDFISGKRYNNLRAASSPEEFIRNLKADGYATSSSYVNTLTSTVSAYNLTEWDNVAQENKKPVYATGRTYTTTVNLNIRQSPNGDKKLFEQITQNAKLHSYENEEGFAVLKKDSKVTCKNIVEIGDDIWIEIPSGYIAAYHNKKTYVV